MKKILILICICSLFLFVIGCEEGTTPTNTTTNSVSVSTTKIDNTAHLGAVANNIEIVVTNPSGSTALRQNSTLTVSWTVNQAVTFGEFAVWVRSSDNKWYIATAIPATGNTKYAVNIKLAVPVGSGYNIIVAYRWWNNWSTSSPFTIFTVTPTSQSTTTTKPPTTTTTKPPTTTTIATTTTTKPPTTTTIPITTTTASTSTTTIPTTTTTKPPTTTTIPTTTTTKPTTTTTIPTTTTTKPPTTTTKPPTTTTSSSSTTTTTSSSTTTTTVYTPSGYDPSWPPFSDGLIANVKDFGAKGDGVTDDRQAIQNTIDFVAGEKTLAQVAPANMDPNKRAYYQWWENFDRVLAGEAPIRTGYTPLEKILIAVITVVAVGVGTTVGLMFIKTSGLKKSNKRKK